MDIVRKFHRSRFNFRWPFLKDEILESEIQRSEGRLSLRFERWPHVKDISEIEYTTQHQKVYYSGRVRSFDRTFLPLYVPRANQLAYALGLDVRREGWIMDQAYDYCGLKLDIPFTKQIEKDSALGYKTVKKYLAHGQRRLQSERDHWAVLVGQRHKDIEKLDRYEFLKMFLLDDPKHQIFDIANCAAIESSLSKPIGFNLKLSKVLTQLAAGKMWIDQFDQMLDVKGRLFGN